MPSRDRRNVGRPWRRIALGWGCWALSAPLVLAGDGPDVKRAILQQEDRKAPAYGPPDGYRGFGLKYHPGYGYGGRALGVGPEGGYPAYGGPGYLHPGPRLNRCGREAPFTYFAGPGFPSPGCPQFFAETGPLVPDRPVIEVGEGPGEADYGSGYGHYTGLIPYPESTFARATTALGTAGSAAGIVNPVPPDPMLTPPPPTPPRPTPPPPPSASRLPGLDAEPVVDPSGGRGLKVIKVLPGGAAEQAGLHVGDEIRSANRHVTEKPGDLAWIVDKASPDHVLRMIVRTASDGRVRTLDVRLR